MLVSNWLARTLYKASSSREEDLPALLDSRQMMSDIHPHLSWLLYTHYYSWWQPCSREITKLLRNAKTSFKSCLQTRKPAAVEKHTSTSEQFSCQVQKRPGLSHYVYSPTCSYRGDLEKAQNFNAMDTGVTNSFAHPSLLSHSHICTNKIGWGLQKTSSHRRQQQGKARQSTGDVDGQRVALWRCTSLFLN